MLLSLSLCGKRTSAFFYRAQVTASLRRHVQYQAPTAKVRPQLLTQLKFFLEDAQAGKVDANYNIKTVIQNAWELADPAMTREVLKICSSIKTLSVEDFHKILACAEQTRDAESALAAYEDAQQNHPEFLSIRALQIVMTTLKFSKNLAATGIKLYFEALEDSTHFPNLKNDALAASALTSLYIGAAFDRNHLSALNLKNLLQKNGVVLDAHLYSNLIAISTKYNDFEESLELFNESVAVGCDTAKTVTNLLCAYVRARKFDEARNLYEGIASDPSIGLNSTVVEQMLLISELEGDAQLCMDVMKDWWKAGGVYTWLMSKSILNVLLTPDVLQVMAFTDKAVHPINGAISPKDVAAAIPVANLLNQLMYNTTRDLQLFNTRLFADQSIGLVSHKEKYRTSITERYTGAPFVPANIIAPLAALMLMRGQGDFLFSRLGSPSELESAEEFKLVVHRMAHDLALLGRWRDLMSLTDRLRTYDNEDVFIETGVRVYTVFALLRANKHSRAEDQIQAHILPNRATFPAKLIDQASRLGIRNMEKNFDREFSEIQKSLDAFVSPPSV